jgi:hypothetical protein
VSPICARLSSRRSRHSVSQETVMTEAYGLT